MMCNRALIKFMQTCLNHESILQSWGINRIDVSDNLLSFYVSGFNYSGKIIVTSDNTDKNLILNSNEEFIGAVDTADEAINILDKYIESNDECYRRLFNALGVAFSKV